MYELLQQILTQIRGMWAYRWYALALAWVVMGVGWFKVYQLPDLYTVTSQVHMDTDSVLRPLLRGLTVEPDVPQQLRLITRTLLTRPNMEKLARMSDIDLQARNPQQFEKLVNSLQHNIKLTSSRLEENLYTVSYTNRNPEMAKTVVQNLVSVLVEKTLNNTREDTDTAQQFLRKQLKEYEQNMLAAEDKLKEFKRKNAAYMATLGRGYFESLEEVRQQKREAELLLREATNRRDELQRQIAGEEPTFGFGAGTVSSPAETGHPNDEKIAELQAQLNSLLLQYTELHPQVNSLRESIRKLEEEKQRDLMNRPQVQVAQPVLETNPVFQQLKVSLSEAEAEVAALAVRVKEYRKRERELKKMVDTLPQIEAEYNRLTREYELFREKYDELRERNETAVFSDEVEQLGDNVKIRVIEPPRTPRYPSGPNRALLNSLVFVAGLAAGLVLSFLLSQLRPVVHDQRTLREISGLPVFGTVSRIWTDQMLLKKRIEYGGFISALLVLFAAYGGIMYIE